MRDQFIQRHLDTVKVFKGLNGAEQFYVSCFPNTEGAMQIAGTNKWIREIDILNIKFAIETKQVLDNNKL